MSKFDLSQYETVKERKARFYKDHEDGRITVEMINEDRLEYACIKASVYLTAEDQANKCPRGQGYALEVRDKEMSVSNYGKEYESINYSSWTENAEESAVGRALDNAGYSGNKKPSREEMQKAERMGKTMGKYNSTSSPNRPTAPKQTEMVNVSKSSCPDCHAPAGKPHATGCKALIRGEAH